MKIVIHVGMHKTGSSSIQHTFARYSDSSFEYVDFEVANHSPLLVLLFGNLDTITGYSYFGARGAEFCSKLPELREKYFDQIARQLDKSSGKTILFSAEDMSSSKFEGENFRLEKFFRQWTDNISVIAYARGPGGFMVSAFQQILKSGQIVFPALPHYRNRFEQIDNIFGRENVTIREFARTKLIDGDVVKDFAQIAQVRTPPEDQIVRSNESLSLEATALLYVQRKFGAGFVKGFEKAHAVNNSFISKLSRVGTGKLAFSEELLVPLLVDIRNDIAWMQDRLGHEFSEAGARHKDAISSLDDLTDIALEHFEAVQELLGEQAVSKGRASVENLVDALERLRETCYSGLVNAASQRRTDVSSRSLKRKGNLTMRPATNNPLPTEPELDIRRKLAHVLWVQDNESALPEDLDDRRKMFQSAKGDYLRRAGNLVQRLRNQGIELTEQRD